ncbi:putative glycerol 1-phosphate dehydrogenase protein (L-arabinose utilization protein) protein [Fulvimarina pelagi HTCC2506]|uniref:Putative glycerol 1-phosphate dehydrogenase protein (L-arabinose utilization protein) protein n=1 Tax=Fulvimarina pelagi HTCC2506 TaxID=314231 RepID=Q0FXF8_9HYPH|nr:putative glycerol 1-phosphate dehydrogenase protein (L-arabinose utilization protein) protein [Fulvimarina pelagi HTCC2506]
MIDDIIDGKWKHPDTGKAADVDYDRVVIDESLDGREAELVAAMNLGERVAIVADEATYAALGERVENAIARLKPDLIVLDHPHADVKALDDLADRLSEHTGAIAVGSGTINDLTKYVVGRDGRPYCVFGTAASMNGYTSSTASITLESGLKTSLPSTAPKGFFADLTVMAEAPTFTRAAGFGDCMARSTAQIDWWMAHRLTGSDYQQIAYDIEWNDEVELNKRAAGVGAGDIEAMGYLTRVLTLCGLGIAFTGVSNHGSMGEHQISHYIDCFMGEAHPGTLHGQQVGVASLTLARLQQQILSREEPPHIMPTLIDYDDMVRRMGRRIADDCLAEFQKKALDEAGASTMNERLRKVWPELRRECLAFAIPVAEMERLLKAAKGATTAEELGIPAGFYREAIIHNREMRNRFSLLDIAADAGLLADFAEGEA